MYPLSPQISVTSRRAIQDTASASDMVTSTTDPLSVRAATHYISKFLLIFVPTSSRQTHLSNNENIPSEALSLSSIISTYFNFSYYLCFSPFKFQQDEHDQFYLHKWLPQQVICMAISATSILIRLSEFRESWPNRPHQAWNPVSYFRVSNALSNLIFHIVICETMWRHSGRFLEIVNFFNVKKNEYFLKGTWSTKVPVLTVAFCISNAIIGSACFAFGTDTFSFSEWNPEYLYRCLFLRAKYTLFLHNQSSCSGGDNNIPKFENMTPINHVTAVVSGISLYFRRINGLYEELFILVGAFTFWLSAKSFAQGLRGCVTTTTSRRNERNGNNWSSVYEKYAHLTELSDLINNAYGPVYFLFTVTSLFYYSINLDNLLVSNDVLVRAKFIAFYTGLVLTFLSSADICRQVGYLEIWISKHLDETSMSELSHKQLSLILHEIATTRVGMTGCHLFTVTYSMVAQLAGVLVTYFIISVQYRDQ